jgi:RNA polymerase sigma-70 factor (ECF subfamily)
VSETQTNTDSTLRQPPSDEFIQLFSRSQRRLFLYILAQVPNPVDAEEIQQETNIVIWNKSHKFQPGTNFYAWTYQIATYEVMKYRDRNRRDKHLFSDEFIKRVAQETSSDAERLEDRRKALIGCLGKLRAQDRELIQSRYTPGENGKSVAVKLGRPINSVYQSLGRIRRSLFECVNRRLTAEAGQ